MTSVEESRARAARAVADNIRDARELKRPPTKQQQLAKLITEIGIDSAQVVFAQVRARLEKIL